MFWVIGFLVLLVALLIPILAIVLDAPLVRQVLERRFGSAAPQELQELTRKVSLLEDELDELNRSVQTLRDDTQFLQRLLENGEQKPPTQLPPPS
jgi:hypothetical protein